MFVLFSFFFILLFRYSFLCFTQKKIIIYKLFPLCSFSVCLSFGCECLWCLSIARLIFLFIIFAFLFNSNIFFVSNDSELLYYLQKSLHPLLIERVCSFVHRSFGWIRYSEKSVFEIEILLNNEHFSPFWLCHVATVAYKKSIYAFAKMTNNNNNGSSGDSGWKIP